MNRKSPRVSVGMPVYNGEKHLRVAVDSILGQTFRDLELIISDNASTDGTEAICREYAARDLRVRYHRHPKNIGGSENYNTVFRRANGQYFKWAASNDHCDPGFIEACVSVLDERPDTVLVYPRTRFVLTDSGETEEYDDRLDLPQERACERFRAFVERVDRCNALYGLIRPEALGRTRLVGKYINSDRVLLGELTLHGKFAEVPEFMFFRRMDPASATTMRSRKEIVRFYYPELTSRMLFQHWKLHRGYLSAVLRAPLPAGEKVCVSRFLWQLFLEDWGHLTEDIREAVEAWLGRQARDEAATTDDESEETRSNV